MNTRIVTRFTYLFTGLWLFAAVDKTEYAQKIVRLREVLSEIIEPNFGFLHELLSRGIITDRCHDKIRAGESVYDRNDRLLVCLSSALTVQQYEGLLSALDGTRQTHVANFIRADGGLFLCML